MAKTLMTLPVLLVLSLVLTTEAGPLNSRITQLEEKVNKLMNAAKQEPVAFHARLEEDIGDIPANTVLVLPQVIVNTGNAYNSSSGIFTAPVDGTYYFTASTKEATTSDLYVIMALAVAGHEIDYAANQANEGSPIFMSVESVAELSAGDEVTIMHVGGDGTYSWRATDFMGFLVFRSLEQ